MWKSVLVRVFEEKTGGVSLNKEKARTKLSGPHWIDCTGPPNSFFKVQFFSGDSSSNAGHKTKVIAT